MSQLYRIKKYLKNITLEQGLLFFVHFLTWSVLFLAFVLVSLHQHESLPRFIVLLYSYGFLIFYLNYFFLTPKLLIPKRYLLFAASIAVVILVSLFVVDPYIHKLSMSDLARRVPHRFDEFRVPPPFKREPLQRYEPGRFPVPAVSPFMMILLLTFLSFSSLVRIFQKMKREEAINQKYQNEKLNAELMMLRQQVNPHFLFNSLNNLHSLANRKSDLTSEAIMKLSAILRYMLSENPSHEIPVTREIALIENYIDLQKLWMKNEINVSFKVENVSESYYIEPFILNPLVENAFKYGALPGRASTISIEMSMKGDWFFFKISNPILVEKLSKEGSTGIGMNNVIRRLELCYPGNFKIENGRIENIYRINLSIKLRNNELHSN